VLGGEPLVQPARRVVATAAPSAGDQLVPQRRQRIDVVAGLAERDRDDAEIRIRDAIA